MLYILNARSPKTGNFIEFRICRMQGRDNAGRARVFLRLDASLYAWPEQWKANALALEALTAQLDQVEKSVPEDGPLALAALKKEAWEVAQSLTDRGLKAQWCEGQSAYDNRKLMGTKP